MNPNRKHGRKLDSPAGSCRFGFETLEDRAVPAIFTVTGLGDGAGVITPDGSGGFFATTLRGAINATAANNENDTITFDATLSGATINLTNGELLHNDAGFSLDLQGFAANQVVIDAGLNSRVFHNAPAAGPMTIDGLDLRNGTDGLGADGGAVFDESGNQLTLRNSVVSGSVTMAINAEGGGIHATGDVLIADSTISNNRTEGTYSQGGAVYTAGNLTVTNSTVTNNRTTGSDALGGALYANGSIALTNSIVELNHTDNNASFGGAVAANGQVTLSNSSVSNNYTLGIGSPGGGIFANLDVVITDGSRVDSNRTVANGVAGGGIFSYAGVEVRDSSVSSNQNNSVIGGPGGGIFAYDDVTITNSTVTGNTANGGSGGAIFTPYGDIGVLNGSTISNNNATYDGGGIETIFGDVTVTDSTISGNTANGGDGGGIFADYGTVTITNSTVSGNTATGIGGGIYTYNGNVSVTSSEFENNVAITVNGGGIGSDSGNVTLTNSMFRSNRASMYGGAVSTYGTVTATGSTITNNRSYGYGGGLDAGSDVTVTNSTVSNNIADGPGGGISTFGGTVTITNSTISGNTSGDNGGGIYQEDGNVVVRGSIVSGNTAGDEGGGIYAYGDVTVEDSTISGNSAFDDGGGINAEYSIILRDSTLSGNMVAGDVASNGGAANAETSINVYNSTISNNSAGFVGGGLYSDGKIRIENSTITGNQASDGGGIYALGNLTSVNSIVSGNIAMTNADRNVGGTISDSFSLIGVNAMLSPLGDYGGDLVGADGSKEVRLVHVPLAGSPALDAGDPAFAPPPNLDERGAGFDRIVGGRLDIGAVEVQTADVAVTKTAVVSGTDVTFTIVATNNGPGRTTSTVVDAFPAGLSNVAYTSVVAGGALGNSAAGTGSLNDALDLPNGATVTYTVTATLTSAVVNTVEILIPAGTVDPDLTNNMSSASADVTTVRIDGGTLFATFTPFNDVGVFAEIDGRLVVTVNGQQFGPFDLNAFNEIVVDALEGNDAIRINDPFNLMFNINGGAGLDTLDLSAVSVETLVVIGSGAQATSTFSNIEAVLTGGADDTFVVHQLVDGRIDGGGGSNTLDLSPLDFAVDVFLNLKSGQVGELFFDNIQRGLLPMFQSNSVDADGVHSSPVSAFAVNGGVTITGFGEPSSSTGDGAIDALDQRLIRSNSSSSFAENETSEAESSTNPSMPDESSTGEDEADTSGDNNDSSEAEVPAEESAAAVDLIFERDFYGLPA